MWRCGRASKGQAARWAALQLATVSAGLLSLALAVSLSLAEVGHWLPAWPKQLHMPLQPSRPHRSPHLVKLHVAHLRQPVPARLRRVARPLAQHIGGHKVKLLHALVSVPILGLHLKVSLVEESGGSQGAVVSARLSCLLSSPGRLPKVRGSALTAASLGCTAHLQVVYAWTLLLDALEVLAGEAGIWLGRALLQA